MRVVHGLALALLAGLWTMAAAAGEAAEAAALMANVSRVMSCLSPYRAGVLNTHVCCSNLSSGTRTDHSCIMASDRAHLIP